MEPKASEGSIFQKSAFTSSSPCGKLGGGILVVSLFHKLVESSLDKEEGG